MEGRRIRFLAVALTLLVLLAATSSAVADPPRQGSGSTGDTGGDVTMAGSVARKFGYQGQLSDGSGQPLDGDYSMQFRLYDAEADGALLWDGGPQAVTVADGLFSVELAPDPAVVNGQALWLEVTVEGEPLPRQEILPVPYAMSLVSGAAMSGAGPDAILTVVNPDGPAILATDGGTAAGQSLGQKSLDLATALVDDPPPGSVTGISSGYPPAVLGKNTGGGYGVLGYSEDKNTAGVKGVSAFGAGVDGSSAYGTGGFFYSDSGVGLHAIGGSNGEGDAALFEGKVTVNGELLLADEKIKLDTDGEIYAKSFHVTDAAGNAITSLNSDGSTSFGNGKASVDTEGKWYSKGVHTTDAAGNTTSSVNSTGDAQFNSVDIGGPLSVGGSAEVLGNLDVGSSFTADNGKVGVDTNGQVYGKGFHTTNPEGEIRYGFDSDGDAFYEVIVSGEVIVSSDPAAAVPSFLISPDLVEQKDPAGNTTWSVNSEGNADFNNVNMAGDFLGRDIFGENLYVTGHKLAVVTTQNYGQRRLYADESAEVYFFDRGQGQLVDGVVSIALDPVFLETVIIDATHPMLVQVTLTSDCRGVFIAEKTATSFTVQELMDGTSNATFDWEVAAKRKGYEDERLEPFVPESPMP